ncbi:restriction endonuclease PLD domain-containing protein [Flavobacterium praedii]|uniref:restriction endonuclease PLD domain-containing protein n=1 Tax=Flavobacterium praedii TaxID=3002900 RepID=UPI0024820D06|nr:restriction endonuclease PLD domain-containing protein [Flavobacterium praedii]
MIINNLYPTALINPKAIANKLYIVSGYASATFARRHIVELLAINNDFEINLIIGMPNSKSDHLAFVALHNEFGNNFKGYYYRNSAPVHCKVYSWYNDDEPCIGYTGSANYSQYGFFTHLQVNQLNHDDPIQIKSLFDDLLTRSTYIPNETIVLPLYHRTPHIGSVLPSKIQWEIANKRVRISFLDNKGILPKGSGLNWGQRLSKNTNKITGKITWSQREPNQAYLSLKQDSRKEGFLPEKAFTFSLITDDGHSFDCVVAQDGRKAIHSTKDNSEIGKYIRNRIGVSLGSPVTVEDLERYGRTDYTIEKIDDETFLLDFSV